MQASEYVLLALVMGLVLLCAWMYTKCGMYVDGLMQWRQREAEWERLAATKQNELVDLREVYGKLRDDFVSFREAADAQWAARGTELSLANGKIAELEKGKEALRVQVGDVTRQNAIYERKLQEYADNYNVVCNNLARTEGERNHLFAELEDVKGVLEPTVKERNELIHKVNMLAGEKATLQSRVDKLRDTNTKLLEHLRSAEVHLHEVKRVVDAWGDQPAWQNEYDPCLFNPTE